MSLSKHKGQQMMKKIMTYAHALRRTYSVSMSQALKSAWKKAKYSVSARKYNLPVETENPYSALDGRIEHMMKTFGWSFDYAKKIVIGRFYYITADGRGKLFGNFEDIAKMPLKEFGEYLFELYEVY